MRRLLGVAVALATCAAVGFAQAPSAGPNKVLKTAKVGGEGGFDYIYADSVGRRLYIPRGGTRATPATATAPAVAAVPGRVAAYNLDTLELVGEIPDTGGSGVAVDPASGHGFSTSRPVSMFDTKTLTVIKKIEVGTAQPDGILFDSFNQRVWVFSHGKPHATVINPVDGAVVGTIDDLGGAPEQAVTDGKGHLYVDIEDQAQVAAVDAKTMTVTAHYALGDKGNTPAGLGFDAKNHVLFVACRAPAPGVMVIMNSEDGKIITTLPLAGGSDGAVFNPATMEAFSSHGNGTMTIIKENSPTSFVVEQDLQTMSGAKTLTLDSKTSHVLTMTVERGPAPAPAPPPAGGGRGGGAPAIPGSFSILVVGK